MDKKIPKKILKRAKELALYFNKIDPFVDVTLKAHLKIESLLDDIIDMFVFNSEFIFKARLTFSQKIKLARSISLDNSKDAIWDIIILINKIRNDAVHDIKLEKKDKYIKKLDLFMNKERKDRQIKDEWAEYTDSEKLGLTTSLCIGFLNKFKEEVMRFKDVVSDVDKIMNPHRHNDSKN